MSSVMSGLALGEAGPVCVALWRSEVTRETFERQAAALKRVVAEHPREAGFLCVVEAGAKPPNEELRRASAAMIDGHGDRLAFVAAVIEGTGFQAAITRSVLVAIELFMRRGHTKVGYFSTPDEAARWADGLMKERRLDEILALVQQMRAQLPPR